MKSNIKILVSGGGSGGHIFPAVSIANEIKQMYPQADILFVGAKRKMEMEKVPKAGYPIKGVWISGFHRQWKWENLLFPLKLVVSLWQAFWIVRKFKPDAVVGVGGYASGPTLKIAGMLSIPTLILEVNAWPGITNRLLAKSVDKICVTSDGMERFFEKDKIILTGNPVRQDLLDVEGKRQQGIQHFGLEESKKTIFIFGGSQGARTINDAVAANKEGLASREDIQLFWQSGSYYHEEFKKHPVTQLSNVTLTAFVDRMDLAYAMADVVICRAGGSIAELSITGKASILVPSPNVAEDHQTANAKKLVEKEAAILVKDSNAKKDMIQEALNVLDDEQLKKTLSSNIKKLAKPNAARTIAKEVFKLIKS